MNIDIKEIIGDRLRERRLKKGWTAREASTAASYAVPEHLGPISTGRWQNWECAQRKPDTELYPYLAKVLDTTPQYLAGWTDEAGIGVETNKYIIANINQGGEADELAFNVEALKRHGLHEHKLHLLQVADDAMKPDMQRGNLILIDKTATDITGAGIYALQTQGGDTFIRYVRRDIGSGYSVYANDEKHAPTKNFSDDEFAAITVLGKFVFKASWHTDQ